MSKYTITMSANSSVPICDIDRRRSDANNWQATVFVGGSTFGSGSLSLQFSPDQGTTKYTGKDWSGNNLTTTSNTMFVTQPMGNGDKLDDYITLYASVTSATNPNITVTVFDNR